MEVFVRSSCGEDTFCFLFCSNFHVCKQDLIPIISLRFSSQRFLWFLEPKSNGLCWTAYSLDSSRYFNVVHLLYCNVSVLECLIFPSLSFHISLSWSSFPLAPTWNSRSLCSGFTDLSALSLQIFLHGSLVLARKQILFKFKKYWTSLLFVFCFISELPRRGSMTLSLKNALWNCFEYGSAVENSLSICLYLHR